VSIEPLILKLADVEINFGVIAKRGGNSQRKNAQYPPPLSELAYFNFFRADSETTLVGRGVTSLGQG
jgi:hypothetical protein